MMLTTGDARALEPGTVVRRYREEPITRVEIAWYMVASYDFNPIHVDEPFAREAGFGSVIGQGMLPLGYLSRELVALVGHGSIRSLGGDFVGLVLPGDELTTELRLARQLEGEGGVELEWALSATGSDGKARIKGNARTWHEDTPSDDPGKTSTTASKP